MRDSSASELWIKLAPLQVKTFSNSSTLFNAIPSIIQPSSGSTGRFFPVSRETVGVNLKRKRIKGNMMEFNSFGCSQQQVAELIIRKMNATGLVA